MTLKATGACALILAAVIAANLISSHYGPKFYGEWMPWPAVTTAGFVA